MKPIIRLAALGFSQPIPINYQEQAFAVGCVGIPSSGASLTWSVQHTFDDPGPDGEHLVQFSQTANTITVTNDYGPLITGPLAGNSGHGLSVADSVLMNIAPGNPAMGGHFAVASIISATSYTLTSPVSQSATGQVYVKGFRWFNHVSMVTQTGRLDGNYAFPVRALRLNVTVYASGFVDLIILQGAGR